MKITKSQLKQIIKEELSGITEGGAMGHYPGPAESEWIDVHGDEPLPPHSMGRGTEGEQTPNLFVKLELLVQDLVDAGEDPEEIRSHVEGVLENIPTPETSERKGHTPEFMINFYQEKPWAWDTAGHQYHEMAGGGDPDGIRSEMYPDWSDEDFAKVISAISSRREEY